MPRSVSLIIRTFDGLNDPSLAEVPAATLKEYFRAFDIDLSFSQGASLSVDPTDSTDSIRALLAEHAPPIGHGGPALLVVTDFGYLGTLVNGMLLDAERRGACAVFSRASGFAFGSPDSRFEVFAHEIGHLLNLTHEDADETFTTAMDSWDERFRVDSRVEIWNKAISGGPTHVADRLRGFFGNGSRLPLGLPMSASCCGKLLSGPPSRIEPWLSPFDGDDPRDASDGALQCSIAVHNPSVTVAQPLDITVTLSLPASSAAIVVPPLLERTSGELVIQLRQPDGKLRVLRPRQVSCTSAVRRLRPRQKIRRNDSFISDCSDLVFPMPGRYEVRALVPLARSASAWETIDVVPASGALAEPAMQEFLRRGMPSGAETHWRQLDEVVADKQLTPQIRADLASRSAARGRRPFELLRDVRDSASPAVAEQDALRRIASLKRNGSDLEALHQAIDRAERTFESADAQHPTLDYLTHLRRKLLVVPKGKAKK